MRIAVLFVLMCCGGCEAIDDFARFHVITGAADGGARVDAASPDAPVSMDAGVDGPMPCVVGASVIGGCYIAK